MIRNSKKYSTVRTQFEADSPDLRGITQRILRRVVGVVRLCIGGLATPNKFYRGIPIAPATEVFQIIFEKSTVLASNRREVAY
jgi:hypothetical protein